MSTEAKDLRLVPTIDLVALLASAVNAVESSQAQMSRLLVELTIRAQAATPFGPVPPDFRQPPTPIPAAAKKVSAAMPKHRFRSPAEIDEIVAFSIENSTAEACEVYNSAASSLSLWRRQRGAGRSRSKRIAPVRHSFDPQAARDAAAESAFSDSVDKGDTRRIRS